MFENTMLYSLQDGYIIHIIYILHVIYIYNVVETIINNPKITINGLYKPSKMWWFIYHFYFLPTLYKYHGEIIYFTIILPNPFNDHQFPISEPFHNHLEGQFPIFRHIHMGFEPTDLLI